MSLVPHRRQVTRSSTADRAIAERFPTIGSVIEEARRKLEPTLWDFLSGGAESQMTLRRNRAAMDQIAFRPRLLRGVLERDPSTSLLGRELSFPVILAPVASLGRLLPDGAVACARVAERMGTIAFLSSAAVPGLEAARARSDAHLVWQMYVRGDRSWMATQVERAEATGCTAICLTVDLTVPGRLDHIPSSFYGASPSASRADPELADHQAALTWEDVAWMSEATDLPLVVKGITCHEDACLAVDHGVAAVYVSNHGGRQLDHLRGTLEVLPEIVAAVDGRAPVIVDSGFVRGSDVVKALALGARAVAVGKLMVWALAAAGESGLEHTLTLLRDEVTDLLAHLGVTAVHDLSPDHVTAAAPVPDRDWVGFPHSLSLPRSGERA